MSCAASIIWSIWAASKSLSFGYKPDNFPQYLAMAPVWAIILPSTSNIGNCLKGAICLFGNNPVALRSSISFPSIR